MRTAERYNGLRRVAPEPRAPMPATKTSRAAREEPEIRLQSKEENLHFAVLSSTFLTSHHKSKANCEFFFHIYIITGFQQERLFKHLEKIKFVSHQRGERQTEPPHNFAQQRDGGTELLYMLRRCAASQQGIITQWQRWMTPRTHF